MQTILSVSDFWRQSCEDIENWLNTQLAKAPILPYSSVDLRDAGFKLAPVDTNLFPAGFNNLAPAMQHDASSAAKKLLKEIAPETKEIIIVPENHTRNMFYFENIACIQKIFKAAGFDIHIGSLLPEITQSTEIKLPSGNKLVLEPLNEINKNNALILLNNDLSEGIAEILKNTPLKIIPAMQLGWFQRLKSRHFYYYDQIVKEFSEYFQKDPWLLNSFYDAENHIDFVSREGEDLLVEKAQKLLEKIQAKYAQYHISQKPFLMIKADSGSYGLGVLSISDPEDIRRLSQRERQKISHTKGNRAVTRVLLQEGVPTQNKINHATAEPVIYMLGRDVIGGFYRTHPERGAQDNLNSPGMIFSPIENLQTIDYAYTVIARLALLAAMREQEEVSS